MEPGALTHGGTSAEQSGASPVTYKQLIGASGEEFCVAVTHLTPPAFNSTTDSDGHHDNQYARAIWLILLITDFGYTGFS